MFPLVFSLILGAPSEFTIGSGPVKYTSEDGLYQMDPVRAPGTQGVGVTEPPTVTCGADNGGEDIVIGLQFDSDARRAFFSTNAGTCWDSSRDIYFVMYIISENGTPFAEGNTVNWSFHYRSVDALNGQGSETGDLATVTGTYTQGATGAGVECYGGFVTLTLPRGDADQPYAANIGVSGALQKTGGTYAGDPFIAGITWFIPIIEDCLL